MTTAISKNEKTEAEKNYATIRDLVTNRMEEIKASLPKHIAQDHFLRVYFLSLQRNPALLECTPLSLLGALLLCAQFGLEPDGLTRQAYLIPFQNNKKGCKEVQVIIGYGGLLDLARRSGQIKAVESRVVKAKDHFAYSFGVTPSIEHEPFKGVDPGDTVGFYAVAHFNDGHVQFDYMNRNEVEKIRNRSKASQNGPWVTDYDEMGKKTVLRRLCKLLPSSIHLQKAVTYDERGDIGIPQDLALLADPNELSSEAVIEQAQESEPKRASETQTAGGTIAPDSELAGNRPSTPREGMETISARFPSKCADCNMGIDRGSQMYYHREKKKAYHIRCPEVGD